MCVKEVPSHVTDLGQRALACILGALKQEAEHVAVEARMDDRVWHRHRLGLESRQLIRRTGRVNAHQDLLDRSDPGIDGLVASHRTEQFERSEDRLGEWL